MAIGCHLVLPVPVCNLETKINSTLSTADRVKHWLIANDEHVIQFTLKDLQWRLSIGEKKMSFSLDSSCVGLNTVVADSEWESYTFQFDQQSQLSIQQIQCSQSMQHLQTSCHVTFIIFNSFWFCKKRLCQHPSRNYDWETFPESSDISYVS